MGRLVRFVVAVLLDCFVVSPRNDAKRRMHDRHLSGFAFASTSPHCEEQSNLMKTGLWTRFASLRGTKQSRVDRTLVPLRVTARHEAVHCRPDFRRASRHCEARSNPEKTGLLTRFASLRGTKQSRVDRTLDALRVTARHEAVHCRPDFSLASRHCEARSNPEN